MMEVVIVDDGNRLTVYELVERELSLASLQSTIAKTIFKAFVRRLGTC